MICSAQSLIAVLGSSSNPIKSSHSPHPCQWFDGKETRPPHVVTEAGTGGACPMPALVTLYRRFKCVTRCGMRLDQYTSSRARGLEMCT